MARKNRNQKKKSKTSKWYSRDKNASNPTPATTQVANSSPDDGSVHSEQRTSFNEKRRPWAKVTQQWLEGILYIHQKIPDDAVNAEEAAIQGLEKAYLVGHNSSKPLAIRRDADGDDDGTDEHGTSQRDAQHHDTDSFHQNNPTAASSKSVEELDNEWVKDRGEKGPIYGNRAGVDLLKRLRVTSRLEKAVKALQTENVEVKAKLAYLETQLEDIEKQQHLHTNVLSSGFIAIRKRLRENFKNKTLGREGQPVNLIIQQGN